VSSEVERITEHLVKDESMKPAENQFDVLPEKPSNYRDPMLSQSASNVRIARAAEGISGFVDLLIRRGIVSKEVALEAAQLKRSRRTDDKRALFLLLIEEFGVDREKVYAEFVKYYSFQSLDLGSIELTAEMITFINNTLEAIPPKLKELMVAVKALPFCTLTGDPPKVQIITPDPTNSELINIAKALPFQKCEICYVALDKYEELFDTLTVGRQSHSSAQLMDGTEEEAGSSEDLDAEIQKGNVAELIDDLLAEAVRINASDIHFCPKGVRKTEIHFRVDGRLKLWNTIEGVRSEAVAAVIKGKAQGPDRFERNKAQDGVLQRTVDQKIARFRVSIIPVIGKDLRLKSESIVIRVIIDPEDSTNIDSIGFAPAELERFKNAIGKPHGMVILTGPTGCGKSTTLLAAIRAVMNPSLNIITVEDPVEYFIDGAWQVKINPKLDFEDALRAILRHDPDIVMVGEIRDRATADVAIKLANIGHLIFSTLHTNDAVGAISRLYKMGVEPFLLAYAMNVIVAQRLLVKFCPRCKAVNNEVLPEVLTKIGFPENEIASTTFYRPVGCVHCIDGYKGRTAIYEVLEFKKEVRKLILEAGSSINEDGLRELAIRQGMTTLRDAGIELLRNGIVTVEEVAKMTMGE
jgi:type IV pilus assembly protein PilB